MEPVIPDCRAGSRRPYLLLCGVLAAIAAGLVLYSQTWAFAWDEGFHLLTAQLILNGKMPYRDFLFPQVPLNAWWTAFCMWLFGDTWRTAHAMEALMSAAAAWLAADYVWRRLPPPSWRLPGALATAVMVGLNVAVVQFGTIGQAYGFCLFFLVAAFRLAVIAVDRDTPNLAILAGLCCGCAVGGSLLTAPAGPILFVWILVCARRGHRVAKGAGFLAGAVVAFLPLGWLAVKAPRHFLFNVLDYHFYYRGVQWATATVHNIDVYLSWIDSWQPLIFLLLAAAGLHAANGKFRAEPGMRREFWLCAILAAALIAHISTARPTFERYFLLAVPFLAILAAAGLLFASSRLQAQDRPRRAALLVVILVVLALGKTLYRGRDDFAWSDFAPVADKVAAVTPPGKPFLAPEHIYFMTKRQPPSGMELGDSHKLELPPAMAEPFHIVSRSVLDARTRAGAFSTVVDCDDGDKAEELGLPRLYKQSETIGDCEVYWDLNKPVTKDQ